MAFERPTFHEAWYRVEGLHPRLRSTVQITRQHFRGQAWHVVQDYTNSAFFRLSEPAYRLIGLLDGKRSVGEAWKICAEQLGDDAPTQGEAIQLLGQLYTGNLLMAELPADTHGLFNRYRKRRQREVQSYLMNLMFIRIPILDPDWFLERWMPVLGWIFSWVGLLVWGALIAMGCYAIGSYPNWGEALVKSSRDILAPSNLLLLYIGFALIKACHEFGHAISCRKFGMATGVGGEVHVMGIMFLVFSPVPYVDASSSWALRSKWQRITVGAAGMWVELAIAAVAAMVWANTNNWLHQLAYNMMFVASFSTLVFNANPLLRYDGYYMLSDLLEIPNLAQRAKDYLYYLVKRYAWGVKLARNPAHSVGEQVWMFFYAIASFIMRVVVSFGILLYLASALQGALIFVATAMALAGVIGWVVVPLGKFAHYLATNPELTRVRPRAVAVTVVTVGALVGTVALIPFPDRARAQGVVDPAPDSMQELNFREEGFVTSILAPARLDPRYHVPLVTTTLPVLVAENRQLEEQGQELAAERQEITTKYLMALKDDPAAAQALRKRLETQGELVRSNQERRDALIVLPPLNGVLIAPQLDFLHGAHLKHGDRIGMVANLDLAHLIVRVVAPNDVSGPLRQEASQRVEIRVQGRPDILLTGTFTAQDILPAGQNELPSPSLGYAAGGQMQVSSGDQRGTKTTEQFFEIRISHLRFETTPAGVDHLLPGQRVMVRFDLQKKPLAYQIWTNLLQLVQKRFQS